MKIPRDNIIQKAIKVVKTGGVIIFPTDTAFGIGCRMDKKESVDRLFKLRKRPLDKPVPLLVASIQMAAIYFSTMSNIVQYLVKKYWPGALTIVAKCRKDKVYSPIRGGGDTIGLRMPDHELILEIIKGVNMPILGSSANFYGEATPYQQEDLDEKLIEKVDLVIPGKCKTSMVSTVIDTTISPPKIIRQGAVKVEKISW